VEARSPQLQQNLELGRQLVTVFWDSEVLLLIDYLPPKKIITGQYYAELMFKVHDIIKEKWHGKL